MSANSAGKHNSSIRFLVDDHKRLIGLFRQYEACRERAPEMRAGVIREVLMELEIHSLVEEQIFYPSLLTHFASPAGGRDKLTVETVLDQGVQRHREIDLQVATLRSMSRNPLNPGITDSPDFRDAFDDLIKNVEAYIAWEESEMLHFADELAPNETQEITQQMTTFRHELLGLPQYRNSVADVVQNPHGGEQMRRDFY